MYCILTESSCFERVAVLVRLFRSVSLIEHLHMTSHLARSIIFILLLTLFC